MYVMSDLRSVIYAVVLTEIEESGPRFLHRGGPLMFGVSSSGLSQEIGSWEARNEQEQEDFEAFWKQHQKIEADESKRGKKGWGFNPTTCGKYVHSMCATTYFRSSCEVMA